MSGFVRAPHEGDTDDFRGGRFDVPPRTLAIVGPPQLDRDVTTRGTPVP